jgi:hypothetical protein
MWGLQGRFHRDGQILTSEGHHLESSDLSKPQNIGEINGEKRCWEAKASMDDRDEQNNFARIKSGNPMLTWSLPIRKALLLDQVITNQLS